MSDELVYVVDEHDRPLAPLTRREVVNSGLWRRAAGGAVIDMKLQQVLCQKRAASLAERPGLWIALFGGKSAPGEDTSATASRELSEELGIYYTPSDLIFYDKVKSFERRQFEYLFWVFTDKETTEITIDPKEVSETIWMDIATVIERLQAGEEWYSYGHDVAMLKSVLQ